MFIHDRNVGCILLGHNGCSLYRFQIGGRRGLAGAAAAAINILVMNSSHRAPAGSFLLLAATQNPLPQFLKASMINRDERINEAAN